MIVHTGKSFFDAAKAQRRKARVLVLGRIGRKPKKQHDLFRVATDQTTWAVAADNLRLISPDFRRLKAAIDQDWRIVNKYF